ncbi:MAG: hypothetical protein ACM3TT_11405, partial [Syntrophothermus sp.]
LMVSAPYKVLPYRFDITTPFPSPDAKFYAIIWHRSVQGRGRGLGSGGSPPSATIDFSQLFKVM